MLSLDRAASDPLIAVVVIGGASPDIIAVTITGLLVEAVIARSGMKSISPGRPPGPPQLIALCGMDTGIFGRYTKDRK